MKTNILNISIISILLSSCTVGKDYKKPEFNVNQDWSASSETTEKLDFKELNNEEHIAKWWENFNDPILNNLIGQALENNKDVLIAYERINELRADRQSTAGGFYPEFSGTAGTTRSNSSNRTSASRGNVDTATAGLDASWELDFFGKTKRALEAAQANVEVGEEMKHGVLLSVTAELASSYFRVRGLQKEIDFTKRNISLLNELENLAELQFKSGVVTELDVNRARGERQEYESTLPTLEADMLAEIYRISVLTGNQPETHLAMLKENQPEVKPVDSIPVGMKGDILRRRPDIRQSERNLAAQTAYIGVTEGALYPSFSLTGSLGSASGRLSDLFNPGSGFYSLGTLIEWDILKGGVLIANVFAAKSREKQAQLEYEKTILLALEDVETSLIRYGKEWQALKKLQEAKHTREESFKIAKYRYEEGVDTFQTVLDAERTLITIRSKIIESETNILVYQAQIYKALGGGWQTLQ